MLPTGKERRKTMMLLPLRRGSDVDGIGNARKKRRLRVKWFESFEGLSMTG